MNKIKSILVIEDNNADYFLLCEYLKSIPLYSGCSIIHAQTLESIRSDKEDAPPEIIFVDLNLPDSKGLDTFLAVNSVFPLSTIIILSGLEDKSIALQAIQAGAQDFILKSDFDEKLLEKTLQYSVERKLSQQALKESNLRYELVSKATNDPIWDWDLLTQKITWNDKVSIFGYSEIIDKDDAWCESNIHPEDVERVKIKLDQHLSRQSETWTDTYRFRCFDGTYMHILDRGHILRNKSGVAYRMIGCMQNITEMVLLEQKLEEERIESQRDVLKAVILGQEKEKDEIGRELHDNINQILVTVKMYLGIAKSNKSRLEEMTEKSYDHISNVMNEIRALSHSLATPSLGDITLQEALQFMIDEINSGKKLKIAFSDQTNGKINDKNRELALYRITQEQLSNILKYAKATEVSICIKVTGNNIHLIIADNGVGFDLSKITKGIGLKNINNRISVYSGKMNIISSPGKGCRLEISIPK